MVKLEALARRRRAVLRLSVHESASEVNRSRGDTQVFFCHRYLVVFYLFVEQLTVFHTSGLVLTSSSIFRVLNLMPLRDGILSGRAKRYVNYA